MRFMLLAVLLAACASGAARAERATERYAPLQLLVARQALEQARALRQSDTALAARFARGAQLDAHLAHRMTDSQSLQREAAGVADESARLARSLEQDGS
jgi:hypothetical protein